MRRNIGTGDKFVRILLGIVIIALGFILHSWWGAIGILPIITAFTGFCAAYTILGISTCRVKTTPPA